MAIGRITPSRRTGSDNPASGVKGKEPIASDWSLIFKLENGFDPFTLQRANGPKSLVQNNTTPLDQQTANGDSSRAGQLFNTEAYAGFSHPTYRRVDRRPAELPHLAGSERLRCDGLRARLLGDRHFEHRRGRRRHRERALQHIGEIRGRDGSAPLRRALPVRRLRSGQRLQRGDSRRRSKAMWGACGSTSSVSGSRTRSRCPTSASILFRLACRRTASRRLSPIRRAAS